MAQGQCTLLRGPRAPPLLPRTAMHFSGIVVFNRDVNAVRLADSAVASVWQAQTSPSACLKGALVRRISFVSLHTRTHSTLVEGRNDRVVLDAVHTAYINACAYDPIDGSRLVSASGCTAVALVLHSSRG